MTYTWKPKKLVYVGPIKVKKFSKNFSIFACLVFEISCFMFRQTLRKSNVVKKQKKF